MLVREPTPTLRPFVVTSWAQRASSVSSAPTLDLESLRASGGLEHVVPTGAIHVVFRLDSTPLRVFDAAGRETRFLGAVVGGPRTCAYRKDATSSCEMVGVQLRVGAAALIFPGAATALAEAHTPLDAVWGLDAERLCVQLAEEPDLARRLDRLDAALLARVGRAALRPGLAPAIALLQRGGSIAEASARSALGDRRFRSVFADAVGLAPKSFARVSRIARTLGPLSDAKSRASDVDLSMNGGVELKKTLASIALEAGFSDQAHFQRDFKEITGLSPDVYRTRRPRHPHHVRA